MNPVEFGIQQAYELSKNLDRIEDYPLELIEEWGAIDAKVIDELAESNSLNMVFCRSQLIDSFDEIRMEGLISDFEGIDYLHTEPRLPIMSRRMLSVLRNVRDFPHQIIPIVVEDMEMASFGDLNRSGRVNTDYVALQLLEQLDIFDRENSVYSPSSISPSGIGRIEKLVLKVPESGLPPIFRITEKSTRLYVSPEAKTALEEAGITGIRFVPLDY